MAPRVATIVAGLAGLASVCSSAPVHQPPAGVAPHAPNTRDRTLAEIALEPDAQARLRQLQGGTQIAMTAFNKPISFHWNPDASLVFVAQKDGTVIRCPSFQSTASDCTTILDISAQVFNYGDHGLTNVWHDLRPGELWLYVTYMLTDPTNPTIKSTCTDYGQMDGRPMSEVNGCPTWGRLSRWALDANGNVVGAEQILVDGHALNAQGSYIMCAQFSTHSITSLFQHDQASQFLYFTAGDGASFTNADYGEMGSQAVDANGAIGPCKDNAAYRGAFRCQDPNRLNGKVARIDLSTVTPTTSPATWEVISYGHRNPHRLLIENGVVWLTEVGWYMYEEINMLQNGLGDAAGRNYGWPCYEGDYPAPHYADADDAGNPYHGNAACTAAVANNAAAITMPMFYLSHPLPVPPQNVMSMTALAFQNGQLLYCDYTQGICDIVAGNPDFATAANAADPVNRNAGGTNSVFTDTQVIRGPTPVEIRTLPDSTMGMVLFPPDQASYTSVGSIVNVNTGATIASPSNTPAPATLSIQSSQSSWTAGSGSTLTYTAETNAAGREGFMVDWTVEEWTCSGGSNNCASTLVYAANATTTISFPAPSQAGVLVITAEGSTLAGFNIAATPLVSSSTGNTCQCSGDLPNGATGSVGGTSVFASAVGALVVLLALSLEVW